MTANLDTQIRYAQLLSESSLIPKHLRGNPANVLLFLALAEAQEVAPAVAFTGFQVIGDTPTMKPEMMRAQILRHGHSLKYVEQSPTRCVITGRRGDNGDEHTVEWTIDTAKRAGLNPTAGTWAKYPQAMLSARATAELARSLFADCLNGISYTPEELGAEVDDEGKAVEAHARAMEDQARQLPPDSKKAERVKKPAKPIEDEWTAPEGVTPPTPAENRKTDTAWFEAWLLRVMETGDVAQLAPLREEAAAKYREGGLTKADADEVREALKNQTDMLERQTAEGVWPEVAKPGAGAAA